MAISTKNKYAKVLVDFYNLYRPSYTPKATWVPLCPPKKDEIEVMPFDLLKKMIENTMNFITKNFSQERKGCSYTDCDIGIMLLVLLCTGKRPSEVVAMRFSDTVPALQDGDIKKAVKYYPYSASGYVL